MVVVFDLYLKLLECLKAFDTANADLLLLAVVEDP